MFFLKNVNNNDKIVQEEMGNLLHGKSKGSKKQWKLLFFFMEKH